MEYFCSCSYVINLRTLSLEVSLMTKEEKKGGPFVASDAELGTSPILSNIDFVHFAYALDTMKTLQNNIKYTP